MIIETILSSCSKHGKVNFAPIGVHLSDDCTRLSELTEFGLILYPGSHTFSNLKDVREGVINLTDDVMSFVDTALYSERLPEIPSHTVLPPRMAAAKTVLEFSVTSFDDATCPAKVKGKVLLFAELGSYSGFCRAQGAILEAVIAATRLQWIPKSKILELWPLWREVTTKTGGVREREALCKLADYFVHQGISIPTGSL